MATPLLIPEHQQMLTISLPTMGQDEFYAFCASNPDLRLERSASGEVIVMSPACSDTGNRNFNLAAYLWLWAEQDGTGLGFDSSTGFTLANGAIRSPDAAWIRSTRWYRLTHQEQTAFAPICPDFVIELRSASDSLSRLQNKMEEYMENGALLGWLIDRKNHTVHLYRPQTSPQVLQNPVSVSGDPELSGFVLPMAKIW